MLKRLQLIFSCSWFWVLGMCFCFVGFLFGFPGAETYTRLDGDGHAKQAIIGAHVVCWCGRYGFENTTCPCRVSPRGAIVRRACPVQWERPQLRFVIREVFPKCFLNS